MTIRRSPTRPISRPLNGAVLLSFLTEQDYQDEWALWPGRGRLYEGEEVATIGFAEGDPITTEYSYKYTVENFGRLAAGAGWSLERQWTDERQWCSVQLLRRF